MTAPTVATRDLTHRYGSTTALDGVSLELGGGRIHGLLGRNGAGKTTLLSVLASLVPATSGEVTLDGAVPFEDERLTEQVCLIREAGDVVTDEKVKVTLDLHESLRPTFDRAYAEAVLADFGVPLKRKPQALSRGQRSAVGVALGLASRAPLTMFDEVHLGMDAPSRQRFYDLLLRDFAESPRTIILSTHLISEIEHLLETVTILDHGRVLMSTEAEELRGQGVTVTGRAEDVDRATAGLQVIGSRDLGPTRSATVFGPTDPAWARSAQDQGLALDAVPLQDLFIHLTAGSPQPHSAQEAS